jgi:hypothetical protein
LSRNAGFKLRVAACQVGLPFDVAFSAAEDFVKAWLIAEGENKGAEFLWDQHRWLEK